MISLTSPTFGAKRHSKNSKEQARLATSAAKDQWRQQRSEKPKKSLQVVDPHNLVMAAINAASDRTGI